MKLCLNSIFKQLFFHNQTSEFRIAFINSAVLNEKKKKILSLMINKWREHTAWMSCKVLWGQKGLTEPQWHRAVVCQWGWTENQQSWGMSRSSWAGITARHKVEQLAILGKGHIPVGLQLISFHCATFSWRPEQLLCNSCVRLRRYSKAEGTHNKS